MALYDLEIEVGELDDGSDYRYMATSPDLPNLIVVGDTPEEMPTLVPQVAAAGDTLPDGKGGYPCPGVLERVRQILAAEGSDDSLEK